VRILPTVLVVMAGWVIGAFGLPVSPGRSAGGA
jgi:hypothetical protein